MKKISYLDRLFTISIRCKSCGGKIRFPVNKGKIKVICPYCKSWFIFSLNPILVLDMLKRMLHFSTPYPTTEPLSTGTTQRTVKKRGIKQQMILLFFGAVLLVIIMNVCDRQQSTSQRIKYKTDEETSNNY